MASKSLDILEVPPLNIPDHICVISDIAVTKIVSRGNGIPDEIDIVLKTGTTLSRLNGGMFSMLGDADSMAFELIDGSLVWIPRQEIEANYLDGRVNEDRRNVISDPTRQRKMSLTRAIKIHDELQEVLADNGTFFSRLTRKHQRRIREKIHGVFRFEDSDKDIRLLVRRMACVLVNDRMDPEQRQIREETMKALMDSLSKFLHQ